MSARSANLKILIVDDHAGMRGIVRRTCAGLAHEFIECDNGDDAVKAFTQHAPDWVIMDVQMHGMDGLKATETIHLLDANARIIVISQFSEPEYRDQARRAGAVEFVSKEDMSQLVDIICSQPPL